jgi:hypothetical protein
MWCILLSLAIAAISLRTWPSPEPRHLDWSKTLNMGGICLGMEQAKVRSQLGRPRSVPPSFRHEARPSRSEQSDPDASWVYCAIAEAFDSRRPTPYMVSFRNGKTFTLCGVFLANDENVIVHPQDQDNTLQRLLGTPSSECVPDWERHYSTSCWQGPSAAIIVKFSGTPKTILGVQRGSAVLVILTQANPVSDPLLFKFSKNLAKFDSPRESLPFLEPRLYTPPKSFFTETQ